MEAPKSKTMACSRCTKRVFEMDVVTFNSVLRYHPACFKCLDCGSKLSLGSCNSHNNDVYCVKHYKVRVSGRAVPKEGEPSENEIARETRTKIAQEQPDWYHEKVKERADAKQAEQRERWVREEEDRKLTRAREAAARAQNVPKLEMLRGPKPDIGAAAMQARQSTTLPRTKLFQAQSDAFRRSFPRCPTELLSAIFTQVQEQQPAALNAFLCACREAQAFIIEHCGHVLLPCRYNVKEICETGEVLILSRWEGGGDGACYEHYYSYGHRYRFVVEPCADSLGRLPYALTLNVRWVPKEEQPKIETIEATTNANANASDGVAAKENEKAVRWQQRVAENGEVMTRGLRWKFVLDPSEARSYMWVKKFEGEQKAKGAATLDYASGFEPKIYSSSWGVPSEVVLRDHTMTVNLKLLAQEGIDDQPDRYTHVEAWVTSECGGLKRDSLCEDKKVVKIYPRGTRRTDSLPPCFDGAAMIRLATHQGPQCHQSQEEEKIPIAQVTPSHRLYHPSRPEGLAIRRIVKTHVPRGARQMVNLCQSSGGECWVTRGHPVLAPKSRAMQSAVPSESGGSASEQLDWFRADELFASVDRPVAFVYNFELESEDEVVLGDTEEFTCCTIGKYCGSRLDSLYPQHRIYHRKHAAIS